MDRKGNDYHLHLAILLPQLDDPLRPPLLIGGNGPQRTLPLAASFAEVWNAAFIRADRFRQLNTKLSQMIEERGRPQDQVRLSLMTPVILDEDEDVLERKARQRMRSLADLRESSAIIGNAEEFVEGIERYREAGVQRIMLQWLEVEDLEGLAAVAEAILAHTRDRPESGTPAVPSASSW